MMNVSYWLNIEENLLLVAKRRKEILRLIDLAHRSGFHIGIISDDYPLLSDLDVAENLAISGMYHQNLSLTQVLKKIDPFVQKINAEDLLQRRIEYLDREELLKIYLLRCIANNNSIILLYEPVFKDIKTIYDLIGLLDKKTRLWIACLEKNTERYYSFGFKEIMISDK
ncbi:MAG: hypothetical protein SVS15_00230 [Thermodesulfobacteriota bacterium]|nr:hypothetical protein [Thermodesulfobacteriota bacterium]